MTENQKDIFDEFITRFEQCFPIKGDFKKTLDTVFKQVNLESVYGEFETGDCHLKNSVYIVIDIVSELSKETQCTRYITNT